MREPPQVLREGRTNFATRISVPMGFAQEADLRAGPVEITDGGGGRWPVTMSWSSHTSAKPKPSFLNGWNQVRGLRNCELGARPYITDVLGAKAYKL